MIIAKFLLAGAVGLVMGGVAIAKTKAGPDVLRQQAQQVCLNDATRLCDDVITDETATFACLTEKKAELSPRCRKVFDAASKARQK